MKLYSIANLNEFVKKMMEFSLNFIGIVLRMGKESLSYEFFTDNRLGKFNKDEHITSYAEFFVEKKCSDRYERRILCLTECCLVERNPENYLLVTLHPLHDIYALIRDPEEPQHLMVEYVTEEFISYLSTDRDTLIASILDGVRASGNSDICVKICPSKRGLRFGPTFIPGSEEIESNLMKFFQNPPHSMKGTEVVDYFNENVSYSGLLHAVTQEGLFAENKERLIRQSLTFLSQAEYSSLQPHQLEAQFHALHRLLASKAGFMSFTSLNGLRESLGRRVLIALRHQSEGVAVAAIEMLNVLMQPMHDNFDILQEQQNKSSLLSSEKFISGLLDMFCVHVLRGTGALVISAMLDFLSFAICPPYCETTDGAHFDKILTQVAKRGRVFFRLFHHPSMAIVKCAGLVMRAIIEEGEPEIAQLMQKYALLEGALLHHLSSAFFLPTSDNRSLANRQLSRQLISLWSTDNSAALELFERIFPQGLLNFLYSSKKMPVSCVDYLFIRDNFKIALDEIKDANEQEKALHRIVQRNVINVLTHWRDKIGFESQILQRQSKQPIALRRRRKLLVPTANWDLFFYYFGKDHAKPDLIWNKKTRDELYETLQMELDDFKRERDFFSTLVTEASVLESSLNLTASTESLSSKPESENEAISSLNDAQGPCPSSPTSSKPVKNNLSEQLQKQAAMVSWNYYEFKVKYKSLESEIRVSNYYLKLLMTEDKKYRAQLDSAEANGADSKEDDSQDCCGLVRIQNSQSFFNELYRRFLQYSDLDQRAVCLEALSIVYSRCWQEIGPINDMDLLISLLNKSTNLLERDNLLIFLEKLLFHKINADQFIDSGGVGVLIELLSLAHLHVTRAHAPLQTNELEAASDSDSLSNMSSEWYYRIVTDNPQDQQQQNRPSRSGPVSFKQLKELARSGQITSKTRVWAQGLDTWRPLELVPQLRWTILVEGQKCILNESELTCLLLNILIGLCKTFPSVDSFGAMVRPLPRVKRLLTQSMNLPHVVQLLLTFDSILVTKVIQLISLVMENNPYLSNLFSTGFFYFTLMYNGANVLEISQLFKQIHRRQAFDSKKTNDSILTSILPDAMLCFLDNYSPQEFSKIFLGEYNNPEVIWNMEMRKYMIRRIATHLAEFTPRLPVNNRAVYDYIEIPIVEFPELKEELFCGSYYLRNLCDMVKFPNWPIRDSIGLLRDILQSWQHELDKKPQSMSLSKALEVLEVDLSIPEIEQEAVIRKSYHKLAQKYHPDRNPTGREMFEKIKEAYDFICQRSKITDGPSPYNLSLLIKSQSIVFSRCRNSLQSIKYSGYPMLIKTIELEVKDEQLFSKDISLLDLACQLAYHTVDASELNAEEFRRENGISLLQQAFSRCVSVISCNSKNDDFPVIVCGYIAKFYAVSAQFKFCREDLTQSSNLVIDLMRLLYYKNLPNLITLSLHAISSFAVDYWLQMNMFQNGALYLILPHFFVYDFTFEEAGVEISTLSHKQAVLNRLAIMACVAVARLCGGPPCKWEAEFVRTATGDPEENSIDSVTSTQHYASDSPANSSIRAVISNLFTPFILRLLVEFDGSLDNLKQILKHLNSNSSTPYLLWDNSTRSELQQYLDVQQNSVIRSGECDSDLGLLFNYSIFEDKLIIGEIFVQIYAETHNFPLENPKAFIIELLIFIKDCSERICNSRDQKGAKIAVTKPASQPTIDDLLSAKFDVTDDQFFDALTSKQNTHKMNGDQPDLGSKQANRFNLKNLTLASQALCLVLSQNPGLEIQCIGHFKMLFGLLHRPVEPILRLKILEVIQIVSHSEECISDICANQIMGQLVSLLRSFFTDMRLLLLTLARFASTTELLKEIVYRGSILYLMIIFCSASYDETTRIESVTLLAQMMNDKLVGRRIRAILLQFLPLTFVDSIRDSPPNFINLLENCHETPDLIWNEEYKEKLISSLNELNNEFDELQKKDANIRWAISETYRVDYCQNDVKNFQIAGVYLKLFVQRPGWILRQPDEFLEQLFVKWSLLLQTAIEGNFNDFELLDLVSCAISMQLRHQPGMTDALPRKGYVHKVVKSLKDVTNMDIKKIDVTHRDIFITSSLQIIRCMVESNPCLQTMQTIEIIPVIQQAMRSSIQQMATSAEILNKIFAKPSDEHIQQAIDCQMVHYLLSILERKNIEVAESGAIRANIVNALKGMLTNLNKGSMVGKILESSPNWASYRDQNHDLFIKPSNQIYALTGGPAGGSTAAGYLTFSKAQSKSTPSNSNDAVVKSSSPVLNTRSNAAPLSAPPDD